MTPTRYPGWRIFGFLMALLSVFTVYWATMIYFRLPGSLIPVGSVRKESPSESAHYLCQLLSSGLTVAGALMSIWRPARGFTLIGAGSLSAAISIGVLDFPAIQALKPAISTLLFGALYTWLGFRQLEADRSTPE